MPNDTKNIVDIDENLRLLGTAHVSKTSVNLVREQIKEFNPDVVAVELCESRLTALKKPEGMDNEDLLKIISEGKAGMNSPTRGIWGGSDGDATDTIEYVQIMTTGNAIDFGNLLANRRQLSGSSNGHGGL